MKVSVIVPIFNVEKYLVKCLDSLLSQSLQDIEFILINDGSSDNSGKICNEYSLKDSRIKVIHQKNKGVSAARNIGIKTSQGEYIGFVDPDDWIEQNMFEDMFATFQRTNVDLVVCGYNYYNNDYILDKRRCYTIQGEELMDLKTVFKSLSDMPPTIRHGVVTKLFKRQIIGDLRFDETLRSSEDLDFLLAYLEKIRQVCFIHRPFYNNLVREGSATHGALNIQSLKDSFKVHRRMYNETVYRFRDLKDYAQAYLLDVYMLKYKEAKSKADTPNPKEKACLSYMRKEIRKTAVQAIFNKNINWKIKLVYNRLWFQK